jgi:phosphoribosylanthranilate isomerase
MNEILLKVNGISSLTDARYCAGMGVEKLGLIFDENGIGALDSNQFASIKAWIEGVVLTGTYLGKNLEVFKNLVNQYQIFEWVLSPELLRGSFNVGNLSLSIYLKVNSLSEIAFAYPTTISGFELSLNDLLFQEGLGKLVSSFGKDQTLFLEDIPNPEFVLNTHRHFPQIGFSLFSNEEERPGWMDLSDLQDMLEQLENSPN